MFVSYPEQTLEMGPLPPFRSMVFMLKRSVDLKRLFSVFGVENSDRTNFSEFIGNYGFSNYSENSEQDSPAFRTTMRPNPCQLLVHELASFIRFGIV